MCIVKPARHLQLSDNSYDRTGSSGLLLVVDALVLIVVFMLCYCRK